MKLRCVKNPFQQKEEIDYVKDRKTGCCEKL